MRISKVLLALAAVTLMATGCSMQKKPATEALSSIESSLAEIKDDAAKYAPDGLKGVESALDQLKENLAKEDYKSVLAGAPELTKAVASLKEAVVTGKAHAEEMLAAAKTEWEGLSADVPKMVEAIQSRLDILSKSKKLPKGVDKNAFESAKLGLESMKVTWSDATSDAASGALAQAAEKAKAVKAKGEAVLKQLGMAS
jgi:hypothetical protein